MFASTAVFHFSPRPRISAVNHEDACDESELQSPPSFTTLAAFPQNCFLREAADKELSVFICNHRFPSSLVKRAAHKLLGRLRIAAAIIVKFHQLARLSSLAATGVNSLPPGDPFDANRSCYCGFYFVVLTRSGGGETGGGHTFSRLCLCCSREPKLMYSGLHP